MTVATEIRDGILIVRIQNPPVNALGAAVRQGLEAAINLLEMSAALSGMLIAGSENAFSGGADIKEFGKPPISPVLPDLLLRLERCEKPVVAAIDGTALGGGLELALACSGRVATHRASMGLPEVNLGLIPGAGGTQRLPRLIGVKAAAEMITSGKPISGAKALELGLVDAISDDDLIASAAGHARNLIETPLHDRLDKPAADADAGWLDGFEKKLTARARGQLSPLKALEAVKASLTHSLEDGLKCEREIFLECMASDQRAALIHSFFIERAAKKTPFLRSVAPRPVETIGVLGAGTMGAGIAIAAAQSGYRVKIYDANADALQAGIDRIGKTLSSEAEKGRITKETADRFTANVLPISSLDALADADLIIEAIIEDMDVKKKVFARLSEIAKPQAVLASNTSYLNIDEIAAHTSRPENVIGMHFFSPAHVMRLLEIVRTEKGSREALATANAVALRMKKLPAFAGVCDGFIGNRIFKRYRQQAEYLVEDGALPQDVDRVMREFGFAMGPFEVSDLAGLDIGWANRRREDATRDPRERYVDIADHLYDLGRLGQKTGAGWYRYEPGDRTPKIDPNIIALIAARAEANGVKQRTVSDEEIRDRLLFIMINEGAAILGDKIAASAGDIDLVLLHGYGFPKYRGGPMFYADQYGLERILSAIDGFSKSDPYCWRPAPLLVECARAQKQLCDAADQGVAGSDAGS